MKRNMAAARAKARTIQGQMSMGVGSLLTFVRPRGNT
jgi:hypothetical protein